MSVVKTKSNFPRKASQWSTHMDRKKQQFALHMTVLSKRDLV